MGRNLPKAPFPSPPSLQVAEPGQRDGVWTPVGKAAPAVLAAIVKALPFAVSLHDEAGTCVLWNPAATSLGLPQARMDAVATGPKGVDRTPHEIETQGAMGDVVLEVWVDRIAVGGQSYWLRSAVDMTAQRKIELDLYNRAYLDELTSLPNRRLVQQTIENLIEGLPLGERFALAVLDIDNFKQINDYYGASVGDALLIKIATRLAAALGADNLVGRIGGDEFMFLLTSPGGHESVQAEVEAISAGLKQPFFLEGCEIFLSTSIGISFYPESGSAFDLLKRNAESAMLRVKSGIKGGVRLFDSGMGHAAASRMALEQRLRLAVRDRRFCCAFQPKVDLHTHEVVGVEVLLRWRDDTDVVRGPGELVALSIEMGLINEIAFFVLAETIRLIDKIDDVFGAQASISLNVAAKQAEDIPFMTALVERLAATGFPRRFMVELTEEAFFVKSRFQREVLPQLRAIGTRVSIDDFGVGYSSLAALADITADEIKIDRSFIIDIHRRPRSQSILRAIESLGQALGMSITAEGVETAEELAYLAEATNIHYVQGYYFAKPLMLEEPDTRNRLQSNRASGGRTGSAARNVPLRTTAGRP